jgi:hypothetical protein
MNALRTVLKEVQSGKTDFRPASTDEKDMEDFQAIAKLLVYAKDEGPLETRLPHKEGESAHGWYDIVVVRGGLSHKGEMLLAQPDTGSKWYDFLQLKPGIFGINYDLKAAWQR